MNSKNLAEATGDHQKPKNLIRSQYKDIMVKVDEDIYYLDRVQLALKSKYFETLFIEDYADKNCELIEIPIMDTGTFSAVVDIIYGAKLESVTTSKNFVSLLMAMDYLQMKINANRFKNLYELVSWNDPLPMEVFKLYDFIARNANYEYLLPVVFKHLSRCLKTIDLDEFLQIPFDHFFQIISNRHYSYGMNHRLCCKICAKWIYHDLENRLPHLIELVNAIKYRFELPFDIDHENLSIPLPTVNEHLNQDTISSYVYKLVEYNGQICSTNTGVQLEERLGKNVATKNEPESDSESELESDCKSKSESYPESHLYSENELESDSDSDSDNQIVSRRRRKRRTKPTRERKIEKFRKDGNFCDVIVKAGEKRYGLHRCMLKSASKYFAEIFSAEHTEVLAKCEGIPALPSTKEYLLDEIDQAAFDVVIDHIYSRKVQFSADIIVRVFKAAHILRIDDLLKQCKRWMMRNSKDVCARDVIEILNYTHENIKYKKLNRVYLSKYVVDSWPEIGDLPQFSDLFKAVTAPEEKSGHSGENKVYLFNNVDQETFQLIINYIYLDKLDLTQENIVRVLKASEIFKIEQLMGKCVEWLFETRKPVDLNSEDLIQVLRFAFRNDIYNDHIVFCLVKCVIQWPEIDDSLFCSLAYETLEDILMSSDLYFDDPYIILDICSKWITHDMENRYKLVPRIALAISRNGLVDYDDYTTESPANLKNCTPDFVKAKLLEILSTISVLPSTVSSNRSKKFKRAQPIFIASKEKRTFSILNSGLDEITSLHICKYVRGFSFSDPSYCTMSAAMVNDNLFLICSTDEESFFHVYNFSLKKTFSLTLDSRMNASGGKYSFDPMKKYTLLNCRNELYCCIEDGQVLKYLFELNRWKLFCESEPDKDELRFTSDGNILYRMYKISQTRDTANYIMESYNVARNSWISLPEVPLLNPTHTERLMSSSNSGKTAYKLTFMNNFGFAVLFKEAIYLFKQDSDRRRWRAVSSLPYDYTSVVGKRRWIISQDESGVLLYMLNNKLHSYSRSNRQWQLKKELSFLESNDEDKYEYRKQLPFGNIVAIHKPNIRT